MVDLRGEAALAEKPLPHVRRIQLLLQHFEGDATPGGDLFAFVNGAHAAASEESKQAVAAELEGEFRVPMTGHRFARRQGDGIVVAAGRLQGVIPQEFGYS